MDERPYPLKIMQSWYSFCRILANMEHNMTSTIQNDELALLRAALTTTQDLTLPSGYTHAQMRTWINDNSWAMTPDEFSTLDILLGDTGMDEMADIEDDYDYACDGPGMCNICGGDDMEDDDNADWTSGNFIEVPENE